MKVRRSVILISAATLVALTASTSGALAQTAHHGGGGGGGGGGSSLTITALSPDTTTPYSNTQDFIYIQLSGNAPSGGTVVSLTSSNQSVMPIPASVTVAAGSSVGQVEFTAGNVTTATAATFTATLGSSSMSVTITVEPVPTPTLFSMELHPPEVIGGGSVTAEPDLNAPAPSGGVTVGLSSSDPTLAAVPSSVTIPAGSYLTNVTITTGAVTAVTDVTITATLPSGSLSSTLQIDPPETLSSLSLNPTTTSGTNGSSGEVTIGAPAPSAGFTVDLQSSDPSVASVPAGAEVPYGSTGTGFTITTSDVTTATTVTITATVGATSISATLTVNPPPPTLAALQSVTVSPGSVSGGGSATGTVTLTTAAPTGGAQVLLASSNTSAATVPASVTVPAGATSATFTVTTQSVNSTTTVSIGGEYGNSDQAALFGVTGRRGGSVLPPPPSGFTIEPFEFGPMPENDTVGTPSTPLEITLPASTLPASDVSVESGSLPPGLSFSSGTAGIVGTPSAQGLFAFVLEFNINGTVFGIPYVWQIVAPLVITQVSLPAGQVGVPYSSGLSATGGVPPYTWSILQYVLPPGLTINSTTGQITGTPTTAGTFSFRVAASDSDQFGFFVVSAESITISS